MIASFTATPYWSSYSAIEQIAAQHNHVFLRVPSKERLLGLPSGTPIYLVNVDRYHESAVRLIFQFPHLHFHLYGHALSIKHPKLRAYLQYHYPEHFI